MEKPDYFPEAVAAQSIDEGFTLLMDWLDAYPDLDVTAFPLWRDAERSADRAFT
jgi:hypothetical protein